VVGRPSESTASTISAVGAGLRVKVSVSPPVTIWMVPVGAEEHAANESKATRAGRSTFLLVYHGARAMPVKVLIAQRDNASRAFLGA
jgi:hypothetical protein